MVVFASAGGFTKNEQLVSVSTINSCTNELRVSDPLHSASTFRVLLRTKHRIKTVEQILVIAAGQVPQSLWRDMRKIMVVTWSILASVLQVLHFEHIMGIASSALSSLRVVFTAYRQALG